MVALDGLLKFTTKVSSGSLIVSPATATLIGIIVGIVGALALSRLLQQTLFEVDATSPLIYLALSVFLLLVTECASWFPARRATRIDPVIALRAE